MAYNSPTCHNTAPEATPKGLQFVRGPKKEQLATLSTLWAYNSPTCHNTTPEADPKGLQFARGPKIEQLATLSTL